MPAFSYITDDNPGDWDNGASWGEDTELESAINRHTGSYSGVTTEPIPSTTKLSRRQKKRKRAERYKEQQTEFDINIPLCVSFFRFLFVFLLFHFPIYIGTF